MHGGPRPGVYRSFDEARAAGAIEGHAVDHRTKMLDTYEDALAFALGVWIDPRTGQRFGYLCRTTPLSHVPIEYGWPTVGQMLALGVPAAVASSSGLHAGGAGSSGTSAGSRAAAAFSRCAVAACANKSSDGSCGNPSS